MLLKETDVLCFFFCFCFFFLFFFCIFLCLWSHNSHEMSNPFLGKKISKMSSAERFTQHIKQLYLYFNRMRVAFFGKCVTHIRFWKSQYGCAFVFSIYVIGFSTVEC